MTILASRYISKFFTEYLEEQRNVSPKTIDSYSDCFTLWLRFLHRENGIRPIKLMLTDLNYDAVISFLYYLENERDNGAASRNQRLSAIKCFAKYVSFFEPMYLDVYGKIQNITSKKTTKPKIPYLSKEQFESVIEKPDRTTWIGFRDYSLILFLMRTGLRVSEVISVDVDDIDFRNLAKVSVIGKGRKHRSIALTSDIEKTLSQLISKRLPHSSQALFTTFRGGRMSVDNVQRIVRKYSKDLKLNKRYNRRVSPHVIRHSAAMSYQKNGVDIKTIGNLLGHEDSKTTMKYMHEDMDHMKAQLSKLQVIDPKFKVFEASDDVLAFLSNIRSKKNNPNSV